MRGWFSQPKKSHAWVFSRFTHIEDEQVVVNQVLHDLHLMLPFPVRLEQAGSKQQRQVLGAHLVQVGTLLDPDRERTGWTAVQSQGCSSRWRRSSPVKVTNESCQSRLVYSRKTSDDFFVTFQPLALVRDFCTGTANQVSRMSFISTAKTKIWTWSKSLESLV